MPLNTSQRDNIDKRREDVARYRLRGWTQRQIAEFLSVSLGTVNRDLAILTEEWREAAHASIEEHKIKQFNELEEIKRAAWTNKDFGAVLKAMKQQADLMGLDAPQMTDITSGGAPLNGPIIYLPKEDDEGHD